MAGNTSVAGLVFKSFSDELAYSNELAQTIQQMFIRCVPAVEFTDLPCISAKLTDGDVQKVRSRHHCEGSHASASMLLDTLRVKPSWFTAFLQALDCREVKMEGFKPHFLQLKEELDKKWAEKYSCVSISTGASPVDNSSHRAHLSGGSNATANHSGFGELPQVVNPSGCWSQCSSQSVHESRGNGAERDIPTSEETVPKVPRGSVTPSEAPHTLSDTQAGPDDDDKDGYDYLIDPNLLSERWFHGNMMRGQAQEVLKHCCQQSFLVRYNTERRQFILSVVGRTKVLNLQINEKKTAGVTRYHLDSDPQAFRTIPELVNCFTSQPLPTHDGILYLCNPVSRVAEIGDVVLHNGRVTAEGSRSESNV